MLQVWQLLRSICVLLYLSQPFFDFILDHKLEVRLIVIVSVFSLGVVVKDERRHVLDQNREVFLRKGQGSRSVFLGMLNLPEDHKEYYRYYRKTKAYYVEQF